MSKDLQFEVMVTLIAASHVATIALLVLWFGLRKPKTAREFWRRFKREFFSFRPLE